MPPDTANLSNGPWWYAGRTKYGRWAFNHRGKRYFAPMDIEKHHRDAAIAWHAAKMAEISPGWSGPKPPQTTKGGRRRLGVTLSPGCIDAIERLDLEHRTGRCRRRNRELEQRNHSAILRLAIRHLAQNPPPRIWAPLTSQSVAKQFILPLADLLVVQRIAERCHAAYSWVAEYAIRRMAKKIVSRSGTEAVVMGKRTKIEAKARDNPLGD